MNLVLRAAALASMGFFATGAALAEGPFTHEKGVDHFGYYFPPEDAPQIGNYKFNHFHIGIPEDMDAWEAGDRMDTYAPVMVEFDDITSECVANELGGCGYTTVRVFPTSYSVTAEGVEFAGEAEEIGKVSVSGKFAEDSSIHGDISYGDVTLKDVDLTYFAGD